MLVRVLASGSRCLSVGASRALVPKGAADKAMFTGGGGGFGATNPGQGAMMLELTKPPAAADPATEPARIAARSYCGIWGRSPYQISGSR